jgi:hypothetical protein
MQIDLIVRIRGFVNAVVPDNILCVHRRKAWSTALGAWLNISQPLAQALVCMAQARMKSSKLGLAKEGPMACFRDTAS